MPSVETLLRPEQTCVCMWSHGRDARKHLHIAVQPVAAEVRARYGGQRSEQLHARMPADDVGTRVSSLTCSVAGPTRHGRTSWRS